MSTVSFLPWIGSTTAVTITAGEGAGATKIGVDKYRLSSAGNSGKLGLIATILHKGR